MRVAILSTFPPRQCGIATFAADLHRSLCDAPGVDDVEVIAVDDGEIHTDSGTVMATVARGTRADYRRAARLVGRLGIDVVMIEHEFGIFGGPDGEYVLSFTGELSVPYAVTLHTVLESPTAGQERVLRELCRRAASVLVFTGTAGELLVGRGIVTPSQVHVVAHGAPPAITSVAGRGETPVPMPLEGLAGVGPLDTRSRFVISTFGLLSPGKGIEVALDAVARLVPRHPHVLLVIAGRTHPEVVRNDGEAYRFGLYQRVRDLGIGEHVTFDDRFLSLSEVAELLAATDVFVTTYRDPEQSVSGALTFALAAGRPVVSTPYRYAVDLLADGAGRIVPFDDPDAVAAAIDELIDDGGQLAGARAAARFAGQQLSWPVVGRETAALLRKAGDFHTSPEAPLVREPELPPIRTAHLATLTDDVGIIQHGVGGVPNRSTGYCVDDVARLAQVAYRLARRADDPAWWAVTTRALAFLGHATEPDRAGMHNLMSYERAWLDEPHVGDHVGRSILALGDLLGNGLPGAVEGSALALLDRLCDDLAAPPPRTAASALIGICRAGDKSARWRKLVAPLAAQLVGLYDQNCATAWEWFEPALSYDNARLPHALLVAGRLLEDERLVGLGARTLAWLGDECGLGGGPVRLPGNRGRGHSQPHPGAGDEQPLEAADLVEAEIEALHATGEPRHGDRALAAFAWFGGNNHLGAALYDAATGGCRDGLAADGVNVNQGAESTLAYLTARLALEDAGLPVIARGHSVRSG